MSTAVIEKKVTRTDSKASEVKVDPPSHPLVKLGDTVYWYHSGDRHCEPQAAIVSRIGNAAMTLNVVSPASFNFLIKNCLHVDDPNLGKGDRKAEGAWDVRG